MTRLRYYCLILSSALILSSCAHPPLQPIYPHLDFIPSNRVLVLLKKKTNKTKNTEKKLSPFLAIIPYHSEERPIISCSPLHLCIIQLAEQEQINDIALSHATGWNWIKSFVGMPNNGAYQISFRPEHDALSTDLVITTNQRTYNIKLINKKGFSTHITQFSYPWPAETPSTNPHYSAMGSLPVMDRQHLHFNYQISGNHPIWQPRTVFDDGTKTFIRMNPIVERVDLPAVTVEQDHQLQLVNYRYQRPYYIIDGLFPRLYLISGSGKTQSTVIIINRQFR